MENKYDILNEKALRQEEKKNQKYDSISQIPVYYFLM